MIISEVVTLLFYAVSMIFLPEYFGKCLRHTHVAIIEQKNSRPYFCYFLSLRLEGRCDCGC